MAFTILNLSLHSFMCFKAEFRDYFESCCKTKPKIFQNLIQNSGVRLDSFKLALGQSYCHSSEMIRWCYNIMNDGRR